MVASLDVPRRQHVRAYFALLVLSCPTLAHGADGDAGAPVGDADTRRPSLSVPIVHSLALMTGMRLTEAYLWPTPFASTDRVTIARHYHKAFSQPPLWDSSLPLFREDGDRWQINVIGHGLFGSELYLRARTCRMQPWQALLFTGVASATWEFGIEASGTRPSALDLAYTPLAGLVLGEARFLTWRAARTISSRPLRTTLSALLDPLGDLERALGTPC